jgi:putative heme transporter
VTVLRRGESRDDVTGAVSLETGELPPIQRDPSKPLKRPRFRPVRLTLKVSALVLVVYIFVLPLIPGFRDAAHELTRVDPIFLVLGLALQIAAWFTYSLLTRSALGDARHSISRMRMFRIQMGTKALSNIVPGGSAASSALGYRLMTLSGVSGPDAGFALATAGLASAVVLNLLFWTALLVSIPFRGVNPLYVSAALAGLGIMLVVALLVLGLQHGQGRAERFLQWLGGKLRFDPDTATAALRQIGDRLEDLIADRALLKRVGLWATLNWLLDAGSLWVFVWAFGGALDIDALLVAFGLANIFAVIPITPGGLGIVEGVYIPTLIGFGLTRQEATLGVASYRLAQFWFPILLGGILYASLRVGPWSIERRDRLDRLRDIARRETVESERRIEFAMRQWERKRPGEPLPVDDEGHPLLPFDVDPELVEALDAPDDEEPAAAPYGEEETRRAERAAAAAREEETRRTDQ